MRKILRSKWIKIPFYFFLVGFALIGFFLTVSYAAIMLRLTDEGGSVDANNRYFSGINRQYNQSFKEDVSKVTFRHHDALHRILILNKYYPKNAEYILAAYKKSNNDQEILRMLDAVDLELKNDKRYMADLKRFRQNRRNFKRQYTHKSAYEWMNIAEWSVFKEAVVKDKALIDSVAAVTGVEGRLIVSCLVGEQIRLFNSNREAYKQWIGPLKILSVESQFSFGVTGIKEHTAKDIEQYLKDSKSTYYLGKKYEHLLDFSSGDPASERISRLTSFRNHFYSYMYAALFLKQVKVQSTGIPAKG